MHRGHEHDHANGGGALGAPHPTAGHNHAREAKQPLQWQTPHRHEAPAEKDGHQHAEADLDLVEAAFVEGFLQASDATSFLRLAHVRFEGMAADGANLVLLRVEVESVADVGSITPHLGGASFRYDPLPARMVSRRKRLSFVYFDGQKPRVLGLAEALALSDQ